MSMFLTNYMKDMVKKLKIIYPEKSVDELSTLINKNIKTKFKPKKASLVNTYTQSTADTTIYHILETILKTKPTITGNGGLFDPKKTNMFADVLATLISTRDHYKGLMLEFKNTDPTLSLKYNGYQSNFKIGTNSVYGLLGLKGSIIYDVSIASSVTTTGQTEITNSIITVESFFGNFMFLNMHSVYSYVTTILSEIQLNIVDKLLSKDEVDIITPEFVFDHLVDHCDFEMDSKSKIVLMSTLNRLSINELATIYYKNNFYEFIKIGKINSLIMSMLPHSYMDLEKHLSLTHDDVVGTKKINTLWKLVDAVVTHYHLDYNRYLLANEKLPKKNIVHTDTDSIFVGLDRFVSKYSKFKKHLPDMSDFNYRYSSMTIGIFMVNKYIANVLNHLGEMLYIPEERRDNILMKTEFIMSRVVMTSKGKWYITKIVMQEGVVLKDPKIDVKGMSFKKSTAAASTGKFIRGIVDNDVLADGKIDLAAILRKISMFQKNVTNEILAGSTAYCKNEGFKSEDQYKDAYTQGPFKAGLIWNALYPDKSIQPGDPIKTYKLKRIFKLDDMMKSKIPDDIKEKLKQIIWENEYMSKYGLHIFGVPGDVDTLPEWVVDHVNVNVIVADNLSNLSPIMESMGLKTLEIRSNKYLSNIIKF